MSKHDWLMDIHDDDLHAEVERREATARLADAVVEFCERVGLPEEVAGHMKTQFELIDPGDFLQAAHHLGAAAYLFAEPAAIEHRFAVSGDSTDDRTPVIGSMQAGASEDECCTEGAEDTKAQLSSAGMSWASSMLGRIISEDESPAVLAREIYISAGSIKTRQRPDYTQIDPEARIQQRLLGMTASEIAATDSSTVTAVNQWFSKLRQRASAHVATSVNVSQTAPGVSAYEATEPERTELLDEPPYVRLTEVICRDLLPDASKPALRGLLDPKNNGDMTQAKQQIIDALIHRIEHSSKGISLLDELDVADGAKASVRALLGIGYRQNGTEALSRRSPRDHRSQLKRITNATERQARQALFYSGVEALIDQLIIEQANVAGSPQLFHQAGKLQVAL